MPAAQPTLVAIDIGNSRIKLGFEKKGSELFSESRSSVPDTFSQTFDSPVSGREGRFDTDRLAAWCEEHVPRDAAWLVASVHRSAAERLTAFVSEMAARQTCNWQLRQLTHRDVPMPIHVDEPSQVGIDRLLAALAADRLRRPDRAAIVVDLGTAVTVDLVDAAGAFSGGAILPGISMSARALAEHTDALPHVSLDRLDQPAPPLGKSTIAAIESGLFWGAIGAIRELVRHYSNGQVTPPDIIITGGASPHVAELLAADETLSSETGGAAKLCHVPHLVLSGIALIHAAT